MQQEHPMLQDTAEGEIRRGRICMDSIRHDCPVTTHPTYSRIGPNFEWWWLKRPFVHSNDRCGHVVDDALPAATMN